MRRLLFRRAHIATTGIPHGDNNVEYDEVLHVWPGLTVLHIGAYTCH